MKQAMLDGGLFLLRLGVGLNMLLFHGWGKLTSGAEKWTLLGANAEWMGLGVIPPLWLGLAAALGESLAPVLIILGVFFRPALALLGLTMLAAVIVHLRMAPGPNSGFAGASHAMLYLCAAVSLTLTGPGSFILKARKA